MRKKYLKTIICMVLAGSMLIGCAGQNTKPDMADLAPGLVSVKQIDSFNPKEACQQGVEVIQNNPWDKKLYAKVFARIVAQCDNHHDKKNAYIIKENFVDPLDSAGKVPHDIGIKLWNSYFSYEWTSLPGNISVDGSCGNLSAIKKGLADEQKRKEAGFRITDQPSPNSLTYSAHLVYNWAYAHCKGLYSSN
ncbi:MAG TPA: hypothetical protein ENJ30_02795 [Desulfobulbaceae bacterium]|nr:hypothetical protein [Desulfobulbaceae bacterium]